MGLELTKDIEGKCFFIEVDGVRLNVYDSGRFRSYDSDIVMLFLHGSPGQISNWKFQIAYFREKYRTVAFDLKGYGRSDKPEVVSMDDYIRDLDGVIERLNIDLDRVVLVGHSFGGMVAQKYASERNIWRLVLIASLPRLRPDIFDKIVWHLPPFFWKPLLFKRYFLTERLYRNVFFSKASPPEVFREFMEDNTEYIENLPPQSFRYLRYFLDYDVRDHADKIKCPTLIIVGKDDKVTPPECSVELNKLIRNSRLIVLENAGHLILYEKPKEINRLIEEFISIQQ